MARRRFQKGYLFKKGKVWVARWWEHIVQADGRPEKVRRFITLGEGLKSDAQRLLERKLRPINHGALRPRFVITFEQFVRERWIPGAMPLLNAESLKLDPEALGQPGLCTYTRPGSVVKYSSDLRCHLIEAFGQKQLSELTRWDVQAFLTAKLKQGYAGANVHGMRTTLSKVLQAAVEWGFIETNPARGCRIASREPVKERTFLTPEQVRSLVRVLPDPCRTIVLVAVFTGLRIGEILALRWGRIDFLRETLSVEESFSERFGPPKTRTSKRILPMSRPLIRALQLHRRSYSRTEPQDLVFSTYKGTPLSSKNLRNRVLEPTRKSVGIRHVSWHTFRYTHTTWLSEAGVAPRIAQSILGHSDVSMTLNVYTQVVPQSQKLAMEKVAGVLDTSGHQIGLETEPGSKPV
jgi:integrase